MPSTVSIVPRTQNGKRRLGTQQHSARQHHATENPAYAPGSVVRRFVSCTATTQAEQPQPKYDNHQSHVHPPSQYAWAGQPWYQLKCARQEQCPCAGGWFPRHSKATPAPHVHSTHTRQTQPGHKKTPAQQEDARRSVESRAVGVASLVHVRKCDDPMINMAGIIDSSLFQRYFPTQPSDHQDHVYAALAGHARNPSVLAARPSPGHASRQSVGFTPRYPSRATTPRTWLTCLLCCSWPSVL